jgi:hypothetical protein
MAAFEPCRRGPGNCSYGFIPPRLFAQVKARFLDLARTGSAVTSLAARKRYDRRRKICMDDEGVRAVTEKWPSLGLPGSGKSVWK